MRHLIAASLFALVGPTLTAQAARPDAGGIAWFGTWQQGLAEAQRTGKPILLMAATPHCHNVPGVW